MENTNIAWAHDTQNFWLGCDQIAPECSHCYIDRTLRKYRDSTGRRRESWGEIWRTKTQKNPAKWQRQAEVQGVCRRVFTNSLSDFFHAKGDPWRAEAWETIRNTPNLVWLILTKRPELIASRLPADWGAGYAIPVWNSGSSWNSSLSRVRNLI
jgi:protein gp37